MRRYLDPDHVETQSVPGLANYLPAELPRKVRNFGYHPPLSQFEPGDLLLFSPKAPSMASRYILQDQQEYFGEPDARWTHAAVYIFDGMIIEATPRNGTALAFLHRYLPTHDILVRRHMTITPVQLTHIVFHAFKRIQAGYPLIPLAFYLIRGWTYTIRPFDPKNYNICSELFHKACMAATRMALQGCPVDGLTKPAHLSATPSLSDVDIHWMKLL